MDESPDRREEVVRISRALYGQSPAQVTKFHSGRHYCAAVSFHGDLADRVIKLTHGYEWAILVEKYLFPDMRSRGLPVPEIEYTHEDYGEPSEPFIVTSEIL